MANQMLDTSWQRNQLQALDPHTPSGYNGRMAKPDLQQTASERPEQDTPQDQPGDHGGEHSAHGRSKHDAHSGGGHSDHGGGHMDHAGQFRRLFWIMLVMGLPVVGLSGMFASLLGYELPDVPLIGWVAPVLGTVMYVWGGRPFLTGAVGEIKGKSPGMMLLIALAITVAFLSSWGSRLGLLDHALEFWWELALLIVIMLLGHWIEMRSLAQSSSALESLAALLPDEAEKVDGDAFVTVAPAELQVDDRGDRPPRRPGTRRR